MEWCDNCIAVTPVAYTLVISIEEFKKFCRSFKIKNFEPRIPPGGAVTYFLHSTEGQGVAIVICPPYPGEDRIEIDCLIVHEATHVWQHTRKALGEKKPSSEFEAYSMQFISMALLKMYHKKIAKAPAQPKVEPTS